ncbi:MAG: LPS-assembly protein LptD [Marinobacter sp.]|nr:LPS-assembly protein LptD [Marinobacter sp.]
MASFVAPSAVWADERALSAAEIDWRPRHLLPAEQQAALPVFCSGGYLPSPVAGDSMVLPGTAGVADAPLEASALRARYEIDSALHLEGDVRLRQGAFTVAASEARFDQVAGVMQLEGPLQSRGEGFLLTGSSADYNAQTGELSINSATFLLHGAELRGSARRLSRPDEHLLLIEQGQLTTCAPHRNDWQVVAADVQLDREEGFGTARHVRLEVKDVPVFYWPYVTFPIDDRRKTGFLYPSFGTSTAGSGFFVAVPYYLNLAPHYDATVTPQFMHGRGLLTEVEGRHLNRWGQSVLQVGYIDDDRDYRRSEPGRDGERWALDFSNRSRFAPGWTGYADYSVVSDNDYLSDLNRSLDINQETHLLRQLGVRYSGQQQFFEAYLNGYQTISDRILAEERPYAQLPEIVYSARLGDGLLQGSLDSQYTYFYRDNSNLTGLDQVNGHRLRLQPSVALDARTLWGYTRPSVTLDHTDYQLEDYELGDRRISRTVPVFEWDSGLYFDRQLEWFQTSYNQTLEPRLYYVYSEARDQDRIPDFDSGLKSFSFDQLFSRNRFSGGDRVADNNQLTVALTSRFNDLNTGIERARVSVGQVYYYDEREVNLFGLGADTRSDSPLAGELILRPLDNLDIRTAGLWDARENRTEEGRSQLIFHSRDYRYLATLGHTYTRDSFEQSDIGAVFPVTPRISLIGRWVYDLQQERTAGSLAGLEYNNCCWSVQVLGQNYRKDDGQLDNRILFQIELKGLGGSGGASRQVAEGIYGFDERQRRRFGGR